MVPLCVWLAVLGLHTVHSQQYDPSCPGNQCFSLCFHSIPGVERDSCRPASRCECTLQAWDCAKRCGCHNIAACTADNTPACPLNCNRDCQTASNSCVVITTRQGDTTDSMMPLWIALGICAGVLVLVLCVCGVVLVRHLTTAAVKEQFQISTPGLSDQLPTKSPLHSPSVDVLLVKNTNMSLPNLSTIPPESPDSSQGSIV